MKHQSKHQSLEQAQLATSAAAQQQTTAREFTTAEELLRHDATQIETPGAIAERLAQSVKQLPPPERSWWQRVLGR